MIIGAMNNIFHNFVMFYMPTNVPISQDSPV